MYVYDELYIVIIIYHLQLSIYVLLLMTHCLKLLEWIWSC